MRLASFSSVGAALDIFLGIVPGAPGICHENRYEKACSRRSGQKADDPVIPQDQAGDYRGNNGQQSRKDHFPKTGPGTDIHTGFIIRLCLSFHQAFDLLKLPSYFYYDTLGRPAYRGHGKGRKDKGQAGPDKDAAQNSRIHNTHIQLHRGPSYFLYLLHVGSDQSQSCQCGRTDSKALSCGGCGISQRIQGVCPYPYLRIKSCHLRNSSCIVCNRTVGICGKGNSQSRKHAHG